MSSFMTGECIPFPDKPITKDAVRLALVAKSPNSNSLLQNYRAASQSRPDTCNKGSNTLTVSVKKTNTISERDFAQLDRLIREKPHSTMLSLEAHILFSNNKTSEWLHNKSKKELKTLTESAQKVCPEHKRKFKEHMANIAAHRQEMQMQRERDKQAAEQRLLQEKERITTEIIDHGLWLTAADVDDGLALLKSETKKTEALRAQIRFRKTLLQQSRTRIFSNSQKKEEVSYTHMNYGTI